jgi:hypothetical protein
MMRTEGLFQNLFRTESDINVKFFSEGLKNTALQQKATRGTLRMKAFSPDELHQYTTWDHEAITTNLQRSISLGPPVPDQTMWLWYAFHYTMQERFACVGPGGTETPTSRLLAGTNNLLKTKFFPFQRMFYLKVQREVDAAILKHRKDTVVANLQKIPQHGTIHKAVAGASFISRPAPHMLMRTAAPQDRFNTNALMTALLESSNEPPVTAENSQGETLVSSTAPQSIARHAKLWQNAIENGRVNLNGLDVQNVAFATTDAEGHLAQIPATSIASSRPGVEVARIPAVHAMRSFAAVPHNPMTSALQTTHELPGGSILDNHQLQANPSQAAPAGYVLTGDVRLFGILPAKLYSSHGTAGNGGTHEIVTLSAPVLLATLFPDLADGDFGAVRFENVQFRYDDGLLLNSQPPGTWLEADMVFEGPFQPIADIMKSVFHQTNPRMHVELCIGVNHNWTTLQMPSNFAISGSLQDISVDFADVVKFTMMGVTINFNTVVTSYPYGEKKEMVFSFFGTAQVKVPGSVVPLSVDYNMAMDGNFIDLSLTLKDEAWQNAFGIHGLALSSVDFGTSFDYKSIRRSTGFRVGAIVVSESTTYNLSGYWNQGEWGLIATVYDVDLEGILSSFSGILGGKLVKVSRGPK